MNQTEEFKKAFKFILSELQNQLGQEIQINSIEFVFGDFKDKVSIVGNEEVPLILNGTCRWDPIKRKVVCRYP